MSFSYYHLLVWVCNDFSQISVCECVPTSFSVHTSLHYVMKSSFGIKVIGLRSRLNEWNLIFHTILLHACNLLKLITIYLVIFSRAPPKMIFFSPCFKRPVLMFLWCCVLTLLILHVTISALQHKQSWCKSQENALSMETWRYIHPLRSVNIILTE